MVIVLWTLELGGAERQAILFGKGLRDACGANVQVWGLHGPGGAAELCDKWDLPWRVASIAWDAGGERRLASLAEFRALRREAPDAIVPYTQLPNVACNLIWSTTGARACIWNQRDEGLFRLDGRWEQAAARRATCFVANSQGGADHLARRFGVPQASIRVIPNGIELVAPIDDRATCAQGSGCPGTRSSRRC